MRPFLLFASLVLLLAACRQKPGSSNVLGKLLKADSLPLQLATIDNTRDTTVTTMNGARLHFPAGCLSTPKARIRIREAYTIDQMILAGLTTASGGKPLQSGGMIYIDAEDPSVTVRAAIDVSVPAPYFNDSMQLYKGRDDNGKIDWTDPKPLDSVPQETRGKALFQQYCATCHGIETDGTGPALLGVTQRAPWCDRRDLMLFTRNAPALIDQSPVLVKMKERFNNNIMPSFANTLSELDVERIYDYLDEESRKRGYDGAKYAICRGKCDQYDSIQMAMQGLKDKKEDLIAENGPRIDYESFPLPNSIEADSIIVTAVDLDKVTPKIYPARYYKFKIVTFGWNNIDALLDVTDATTSLKVKVEGAYGKDPSVFIIIPNYRVFYEGGLLAGSEDVYGFFTRDGKIPLPEGTQVTVMALSEGDDRIVYDSHTFLAAKDQTIMLTPEAVSKAAFNRKVRRFGFADMSFVAQETPNADEMRKIDKQLSKMEKTARKYLPAGCDCSCANFISDTTEYPHADSTAKK